MRITQVSSLFFGAIIGTLCSSSALAQTMGGETAAQGLPNEIVVTAQRRGEAEQRVPIAISAIDDQALKTRGINNPTDLVTTVPSLSITQNVLSASLFIRGIGQTGGAPNNENSVAMYIDDVYLGTPQMTLTDFVNLAQVAVLKGPQGTLFGRNSTGGVVQFTTRDPRHETAVSFAAGYGNYDRIRSEFYGTTGLGDRAAIDLAAIYEKQNDGYGSNLTRGNDTFRRQIFSLRSKLLLEPFEGTTIRISADYSDQDGDAPYRPTSGNPQKSFLPNGAGAYDVVGNFPDYSENKNYGGSIKIDQDLGFADLVSISAYRNNRFFISLDQDTLPIPIADVTNLFKSSYFTQEIQLLSNSQSNLSWTIGAFYLDKKDDQDPLELRGIAATANGGFLQAFATQNTKSYAAYGQATYPVLESTNVTAGLRYTKDDFEITGRTVTGLGTVAFPQNKTSQSAWTWRASVDHNFSDDIMTYASYNRGVKSGGFNLGAPTAAAYKPEKLDAYEIGFKAMLFDRRLRVNGAAFYYDYANIQVQSVQQGFVLVANAAAATIKGIDLDATLTVTPNWRISAAGSVLDGKYDSYTNAVVFDEAGVQLGGLGGLDVTGEDTIQTPKFTGTFTTDYELETGIGSFLFTGSVSHYSGAWFQPGQIYRLPRYTVANASILWTALSELYEVQLWAKNLTDKRYVRSRFGSRGIGGYEAYAPPRTYGVTLRAHF